MLYPSMNDLLKKVDNRYMLVNLTAKRARDIATAAEEQEVRLTEKPVKLALNDIIEGHVALMEKKPCEEAEESGIEMADEVFGEEPAEEEACAE